MKYTFEHNGKQKTVNIDDEWLNKRRTVDRMSVSEAIELWLFDHDYIGNAEADALTRKAESAGVAHDVSRKPRKAPERKPDDVKRDLVQTLFTAIERYAGAAQVQITNPERMIAFSLGEDNYEITLTRKRKPKA